ncbi:MAG: TadE/TadG family type IV pilus assembly protein [Candidatus Binatia bacterium]
MPNLSGNAVLTHKGQATVEFALAALIFFTAFLAIVEFAHLFYTKLTLQHALNEAGRFMVTGQTPGPLNRAEDIKDVFCKKLIGTGLSCPALGPDFLITCGGVACSAPGGSASETVVVTATFTKPWFTVLFDQFVPGGVTLTIGTTWKNEPFA